MAMGRLGRSCWYKLPPGFAGREQPFTGHLLLGLGAVVHRQGHGGGPGGSGTVMEIVAGIGQNANLATRTDVRFGSTRLVQLLGMHMGSALSVIGWILLGTCLGAGGVVVAFRRGRLSAAASTQTPVVDLVRSHFHPVPLGNITISERKFPFRVRADLQRAIDRRKRQERTALFSRCSCSTDASAIVPSW